MHTVFYKKNFLVFLACMLTGVTL